MESNQISGLLSVILGLIFIICPIFSTTFLSIFIGLSLVFFGIAFILSEFSVVNIVVGILAILVGLILVFNITVLSFVFGLQFYIIGIIMILAGSAGLFRFTIWKNRFCINYNFRYNIICSWRIFNRPTSFRCSPYRCSFNHPGCKII